MDINGLPIEGFQSINLSAGLGAVPPLSASLRDDDEGTADVTESEMEHIILEYKAAQTAKEAEKVLKRNAPDGRMSRILDGLEDEFF
ncbi:MAG: hypothetical protein NC079_06030 [Clostridium sp.]|nr:hypothetical protein [Acetatifactor muris]MCM1526989.1 hypothetical protein [Bacteroides sp.]MCM1563152.1 hypothetical protein [Clostridium sp.]